MTTSEICRSAMNACCPGCHEICEIYEDFEKDPMWGDDLSIRSRDQAGLRIGNNCDTGWPCYKLNYWQLITPGMMDGRWE